MEIVFVRHFPTPGNRLRRYIGSTDEHLDMEAIKKGFYLSVECVVASPMKRCLETASIIYPTHKPMLCELMKECDFGIFEAKCYEELKDEPAYQKWLKSGGEAAFPGGESRSDFQRRCVRGLEEMLPNLMQKKYQKVAFVVHGGTIMAVLSAFDKEKREFYHWQVANGEGYEVHVDDEAWMKGEKYFTEIRKI